MYNESVHYICIMPKNSEPYLLPRSPNKTFETDAKHVLNTTFDSGTKISPPQAAAEPVIRPAAASDADRYQRKMSEDRLSSASSR